MALIIMCGRPMTGKTRRAEELALALSESEDERVSGLTIHTVSNDAFDLDKVTGYSTAQGEKELRGNVLDHVERALGADTIVICDSSNYIKGFRYQLYCAAKAEAIPSCVVWTDTPDALAVEWNDAAGDGSEPVYPHELFDDLWSRFEIPDGRKRWDKPLFVVGPDDELPLDDMVGALFYSKPVVPNASTRSDPAVNTEYLALLDAASRSVMTAVLGWITSGGLPGQPIVVGTSNVSLVLNRLVTAAEVRRARKQFLKLAQVNPPPIDQAAAHAAEFIASAINQ